MWKVAFVTVFALAAFAAAKEEDKKIDGPVIGIDLGTWLHKSLETFRPPPEGHPELLQRTFFRKSLLKRVCMRACDWMSLRHHVFVRGHLQEWTSRDYS